MKKLKIIISFILTCILCAGLNMVNTFAEEINTTTDSAITDVDTTTDSTIDYNTNKILSVTFDETSSTPSQKIYSQGEYMSFKVFLSDDVNTNAFKYISLEFTSNMEKTISILGKLINGANGTQYFTYNNNYYALTLTEAVAPVGEYTLTDVKFLDSNKTELSNLGIYKGDVINNSSNVVKFTVLPNTSTVKLTKPIKSIPIGTTVLIAASMNGVTIDPTLFDWTSSNTDIATVGINGEVTTISNGKATIKATLKSNPSIYGYINLPCYTYQTSILLNKDTLTGKVGKTYTLTAIPNANATYKSVTWSSADPSIATVSSKGIVTPKSNGATVITATASDGSKITAKCTVIVCNMVIVLDPGHGGIDVGAVGHGLKERDLNYKIATYLKTELEKYNGVVVYFTHKTFTGYKFELYDRVIKAKSYDGDVLISLHNNAGSTTAKGAEVIISRYTGTSKFNKEQTQLGNAILDEICKLGIARRTVYSRQSTIATNKYSNGQRADYYGMIRYGVLNNIPTIIIEHAFISSSDYTFLNSDSKLKKLAIADAKGIAKHYRLDDSTAYVSATSVSLDSKELTLTQNTTKKLTASVLPSKATVKSVKYITSNSNVATVSSDGVVTGKTLGTATITATSVDGGFNSTCKVTIVDKIAVTGVKLIVPKTSLEVGKQFQLTPSFIPANATNQNHTFKSANTSIATISKTGVVTAKKAGSVMITLMTEEGSYLASVTIKVVPQTLIKAKNITLNIKSGGSVPKGSSFKLLPKIAPTNVTYKGIKYTSSNNKILTVSSTGIVKGITKGKAAITVAATDGSKVQTKISVTVK